MHFNILEIVLLSVIAVTLSCGAYIQIRMWWKLRGEHSKESKRAYAVWIERSTAFAHWRSENPFENFEHRHYQWHLREEASAFSHLLSFKTQIPTKDHEHLARLKCQIKQSLQAEEPPHE